MFLRTPSLKRLNSFEALKTYLAVFRRTQVYSFNSWFANGGIVIASASNMTVCQVCGQ